MQDAVFTMLKREIDATVEKYGKDNAPPPWTAFTVPNKIEDGNFHVVQKVFDGPFEVYYGSMELCVSR